MDTIYYYYNKLFYEYTDTRVLALPLMGSATPFIIIITSYLIFIKKIGPAWMKNRPAYNIKAIIQVYNVIQIALNFGLACHGIYRLLKGGKFRCIAHLTNSEEDMFFVRLSWSFYMLKLLDLFDTVFFVLRKRFDLITTLHVYHHTMMSVATFLLFRWHPAGEATIMGLMNGIVHSVMYFYYFYCLQSTHKVIWWKKYITILQLVQFCILLLWYAPKIFINGDCAYPTTLNVFISVQAIVMLRLFGSYYYYEFINPKAKKKTSENNNDAKSIKDKNQ